MRDTTTPGLEPLTRTEMRETSGGTNPITDAVNTLIRIFSPEPAPVPCGGFGPQPAQ
ncbi:MAG TPA: hypothetical protein VF263_20490 [Longimicrobiaceae bacterium]